MLLKYFDDFFHPKEDTQITTNKLLPYASGVLQKRTYFNGFGSLRAAFADI